MSRYSSAASSDPESEDKSTSKKLSKNKRKRVEAVKVYKSAEFISDSDLEVVRPEKKPAAQKKTQNPLKRPKFAHDIDSEDNHALTKKSNPGKDEDRDLETSPLLNETETYKRKNNSGASKAKVSLGKEKIPKSKPSNIDKDDAMIKRLKSFVNACGVRKNWSKVFQDCPKPSQQIGILKDILSELGMTTRFSMEQAKRIKQKREFAQELADVQSFEQSMLSRSSRKISMSKDLKSQLSESGNDDSEDEKPIKLKGAALRSISAFLGDQSDGD